jgi:integrase
MATVGIMGNRKRHEYGDGSVYQRKSDGLWIGSISQGWTATGARRRINVSAKTEGEARRKLRDKLREIEREGLPTQNAKATVKQWAETWLALQEKRLRPGGYRSTRAAVNLWIIPAMGHKRFADLTPADIRAVATAQEKAGRAGTTALRTHSVLMSLLKAAMLEGHPVHPRLLQATAPIKSVNDRDAMTVEEALAIIPLAGELHHGSRFLAALLQGMRQGECLGLTWPMVNLDANTITVSWQLQALPYRVPRDRKSGFRIPDGYEARQLQGALHLVRPKTKAGYRVIPIVPVMREALAAWRERQAELIPDNPHDLVWPDLDGSPTSSKVDDAEWFALQCAAGVSHPRPASHPKGARWFTIHEARHTTATLLLECGVDPTVIVAIMGHSSILTTRGYQHVRTERAMEALGLVAERLQLGRSTFGDG